MLRTSPSSCPLTSVDEWQRSLWDALVRRSSKVCHACCRAERLQMWSQLGTIALYPGESCRVAFVYWLFLSEFIHERDLNMELSYAENSFSLSWLKYWSKWAFWIDKHLALRPDIWERIEPNKNLKVFEHEKKKRYTVSEILMSLENYQEFTS